MSATPSPPLDLVCLGEAMIEFNQAPGDPTRYTAGFGGDTSNCAIAAARIGARSGYITQVGDDVFGAQLLALWRDEGVDTAGVRVLAAGETGVYFVTHGAQGHAFTYRRAGSAASRMAPDDAAFAPCIQQVGRASMLHVSGISQAISASACAVVVAAIERARAQACAGGLRPQLSPAAVECRGRSPGGRTHRAAWPTSFCQASTRWRCWPVRYARRGAAVGPRLGCTDRGVEARSPRLLGVAAQRRDAAAAVSGVCGRCHRRRRLLCRHAAGAAGRGRRHRGRSACGQRGGSAQHLGARCRGAIAALASGAFGVGRSGLSARLSSQAAHRVLGWP